MNKILMGLFVISGLFTTQVFAAGDASAGKVKSASCAVCHGTDGRAVIPGYPHLNGQNEKYLISSMTAYKNKQRTGGFSMLMEVQSTELSEQDIADLAAFYASLN